MENRQYGHSVPGTSLVAESPEPRRPRRRPRWVRWTLVTAAAGSTAAGAVLILMPAQERHRVLPPAPAPRPAAGPRTQALTTVTAGVPAALPDLAALIARQERTVQAQPHNARAWAVLGTAYVEQGRQSADTADYPKAERALRAALEVQDLRDADRAAALGGMAALANARRDFPQAKEYGEQLMELTPKQWTAYPPLIDAYTGLGDYKNARSTLDKLMGLKTDAATRPAVMARASAVYRDRGWREDAVAQLTDAASAARTPAEQAACLTGLGQLAWERGDLSDALRHFEAAGRLDPGQRAAAAGQGRTLAAMGRTSQALAAYQAASGKQPDPRYALELGELYESLGMNRDAERQYDVLRERAQVAEAGGVDEDLLLGQLEADHGDPQEAVLQLEDEWRRQPGIEVADALGWALHRAGDDEEALTYAETATDKTKGGGVRSALYVFHRGIIERELDQDSSARRHLKEALQINPYFSPLQAPAARSALRELGDVPDEPVPQ
ncbi:tetratricopeptide repeat protein [Streptomyces sp. NPDC048297]|uniref:tetratricopeptide repeat protein n=1 Tax=Streptomyces sp. NPDC048297 TaxID=3365531 RepID=UPI0037138DBB